MKVLILISLLFSVRAFAETEVAEKFPDVVLTAIEKSPKPKDGTYRSWVPLGGFNPTYNFFFGGGYFFKTMEDGVPVKEFGMNGISTVQFVVKLESFVRYKLSDRWALQLNNEIGRGFEPNYGRGGDTKAQDRVDVPLWKDEFNLMFPIAITRRFSIAPVVRYKIRRNHAPYSSVTEVDPMAPEEQSAGVGVVQELDFRNIPASPMIGWYQAFRVTGVRPFEPDQRRTMFSVFDGEIRVFHYLKNPELVLATSLAGGLILGTPTYLYEHRLGGTDRLRGFFYDRFRGDKYYVQQSELRFPLYKFISGAVFLEFGEVTEQRFDKAQLSYGGGLRIGLPPDGIEKIRIDYGVSFDQRGVSVDFGHAF